MADEPLVPREELRATLQARQELGPAYEPELLERFAQELERRLEARPAKAPRGKLSSEETGIVIVSILASIPLMGIAGGTVGLAGVIAVCAALVLVNYLVLRR
ncbi:MAG TPA: hypothetical protein VGQ84_13485 [Gaiellaceae bacterium]|jgi:hypothetical protein|nr:hypothetical protein [Gaiellaceae bacterium]